MWKELSIEKINNNKPDPNKFLEDEESDKLLTLLEESGRDELARLCRMQLLTGMRVGELVSIEYDRQIDFDAKTILIDRTYNTELNNYDLPKNGEIGTIDINDDVLHIIRKQRQCARMKIIRYKK